MSLKFSKRAVLAVAVVSAGLYPLTLGSSCRADFLDDACIDGIVQGAIEGISECSGEPEAVPECGAAGAIIGGVDAGCLDDNNSPQGSDVDSGDATSP